MCVAQAERAPVLRLQRFRQQQEHGDRIDRREPAGDDERRPGAKARHDAAQRRPNHEADAERSAKQSKGGRPFLRRSHVGNHGSRRTEGRAGDARNRAADEKPGQSRRPGHDEIVDRERDHCSDQHDPPAEAIAEIAHHRTREELRNREYGKHPTRHPCRLRQVDLAELRDQLRQHRHDDPEADDVNRHRRKHDRHSTIFETEHLAAMAK